MKVVRERSAMKQEAPTLQGRGSSQKKEDVSCKNKIIKRNDEKLLFSSFNFIGFVEQICQYALIQK
jgi:hypothetical protein